MRIERKSLMKRLPPASALLLLAPVAAAAQVSGVEAHPVTDWIFRWLNFALVFGVGGWWVGRKLKVVFRRRADKIYATIAEAEAERRQAIERLQAAEASLAGLEREAAEMRDRARRDSAAEADRIRAMAREDAERIERAADAEIAAAERTAVNRLRDLAVARTIERARELVVRRMTPAVDARLFQRFVAALDRVGSRS